MFQAPEVTPADQIPEFKWVAPDEEVRAALCAPAVPRCFDALIGLKKDNIKPRS